MKSLNIQLQRQPSVEIDVTPAVALLVETAQSHGSTVDVNVDEGAQIGPYANINIDSRDVANLWSAMRPVIVRDPILAACSIASCEGDCGWEDYLLLFHFDEKQPLDAI